MTIWADEMERNVMDENARSAVGLLAVLRHEGLKVERIGSDVLIGPKAKLTCNRRFLIRILKPAILAVLAIEEARDAKGNP